MEYQYFKEQKNERAKRTRTLIQLGGLVVKSGLAEKLNIPIGEDLQQDHLDKAAILLGCLMHSLQEFKEDSVKIFKETGKQKLYESAYEKQ